MNWKTCGDECQYREIQNLYFPPIAKRENSLPMAEDMAGQFSNGGYPRDYYYPTICFYLIHTPGLRLPVSTTVAWLLKFAQACYKSRTMVWRMMLIGRLIATVGFLGYHAMQQYLP
jgi:hypothetical protein